MRKMVKPEWTDDKVAHIPNREELFRESGTNTMEHEEDNELLERECAKQYRSMVARGNLLDLDRPDIRYSVKEQCRQMSSPCRGSWNSLKKLCRFLMKLHSCGFSNMRIRQRSFFGGLQGQRIMRTCSRSILPEPRSPSTLPDWHAVWSRSTRVDPPLGRRSVRDRYGTFAVWSLFGSSCTCIWLCHSCWLKFADRMKTAFMVAERGSIVDGPATLDVASGAHETVGPKRRVHATSTLGSAGAHGPDVP